MHAIRLKSVIDQICVRVRVCARKSKEICRISISNIAHVESFHFIAHLHLRLMNSFEI